VRLNPEFTFHEGNRIVEISEYALEMDTDRNVLDRDDVILDQRGLPINAEVSFYSPFPTKQNIINVVLF
jgi:hypothetical protein